jgi:hypothetical protein
MANPFTQAYLTMVSRATEVQSVRLNNRIFPIGDYAIFESPFIPSGAISQIDDRSAGVPQDNALAWLPNLAQLMELFGGYPASLQAMRKAFFGTALSNYFEGFNSWEECTLAVLMLEKFQKVWSGDAWIPVPPSFQPSR